MLLLHLFHLLPNHLEDPLSLHVLEDGSIQKTQLLLSTVSTLLQLLELLLVDKRLLSQGLEQLLYHDVDLGFKRKVRHL